MPGLDYLSKLTEKNHSHVVEGFGQKITDTRDSVKIRRGWVSYKVANVKHSFDKPQQPGQEMLSAAYHHTNKKT